MGQTGFLALAFEPKDKDKVIALVAGYAEDGSGEFICYQPEIHLIREDNFEVHRALEELSRDIPELAGLGTIVRGVHPVTDAGMGIQSFFSASDVKTMADAYRNTTTEMLDAAIERIRPEFEPRFFVHLPTIIRKHFEVIRDELSHVARNGWALLAGMF